MNLHFISGLPRSGTTLLAAILLQNPNCWASIITPTGPLVEKMLAGMSAIDETHILLSEEDRERVFTSAIYAYHVNHAKTYVFDNNRMWAAKSPFVFKLFSKAKMVVLLRPYTEIIESFERLFREHPTAVSKIYGLNSQSTVYQRTDHIISSAGVLGYAVNATQEAWASQDPRILFVQYHDLVREPGATLQQIHKFCDMPPFDYNFHKIKQIPGVEEFDKSIGTPGLHNVNSIVREIPRKRCLPENVYAMLAQPFWLKE